MHERYYESILKFLSKNRYQPFTPRQLARQMGISEEQYPTFRTAVKRLRDSGRLVLGSGEALTLPELPLKTVGYFTQNPRGFGFVRPESPNSHGDLYIPAGETGTAVTGDRVEAHIISKRRRGGRKVYAGKVTRILERRNNRFVGTLQKTGSMWFVISGQKTFVPPIIIRDVPSPSPKKGTKVVTEIVSYGEPGELPTGVIVERLGPEGQLGVETRAVIRSYGLKEEFSKQAWDEARKAAETFDPRNTGRREDLTALTVITIDPPEAKDFDDALSLKRNRDGGVTLGVHIADVSHFVRKDSPLDNEACDRGTSVYFPKKVVPMLPEVLSNGVCSLQEGQPRFCKSVFISYDKNARVTRTRLAETVISSNKRLTYREAQGIIDGNKECGEKAVAELLQDLNGLAKKIEKRRRKHGMIHLDLPAVGLVFDNKDNVVGTEPADTSYTHTLIEMFMVEANEAVASKLKGKGCKFLRRIHRPPPTDVLEQLSRFLRAAGFSVSRSPTQTEIQRVLDAASGTPESFAVNLAVLKAFERAEYAPLEAGHYGLGSKSYCHFTSPIRRYPDLTVHRLVAEYCRRTLRKTPEDEVPHLLELGEQCTDAEKKAEAAEAELRELLLLQFLQGKIGDEFDGVIAGVTNFGVFVQNVDLGIEGLIPISDLGDDWWEVNTTYGFIRGEHTGRTFRIGDTLKTQIAWVNVERRQLHLVPAKEEGKKKSRKTKKKRKKSKGKGKLRGKGRKKRRSSRGRKRS